MHLPVMCLVYGVDCRLLIFILGNFIYQNYRHALKRIKNDTPKLAALSVELNASAADYEAYLVAKREHLESLKTEPEEVLRTVKYMEALKKLEELQYVIFYHL
jgi:hypothetical protein